MERRVFGGLRIRLALLMLLALFPLGLIAMWQTYQVVEDNRLLNRERLAEVTTAAAARHSAAIQQAFGAGLGLASAAADESPADCRAAMRQFQRSNPDYTLVGFIALDGRMTCNSADLAVINYSDDVEFIEGVVRAEPYVDIKLGDAASGQTVVIVRVPVFRNGTLQGFVSLSLPRDAVSGGDLTEADAGVVLTGITKSDEIFSIIAGPEGAAAHLPSDLWADDIISRAGSIFEAVDQSGQPRLYSVTPLIADSYVVVGSWPRAMLTSRSQLAQAAMPLAFAVAMWAAGMVVAYLGLSRLVLRHLADLRSAMRRFALGERLSVGLDLDGAPDEFKDAERAFNRMAILITEAEARQMTDLHDREVLLREVHHRVKNNLQMIASIMNLQARAAQSDETKEVLSGLQRRVRGMAMLHRSLYTTTDTSQVDAQDLIAAVVSDTSSVMPDKALQIDTTLTSVMLYPDQAVPLSMWMAEALTNAVKYVGSDGEETAFIRVTLSHDGAGTVDLALENTIGAATILSEDAPTESTGLGGKLMTAFCRQLDGDVDITRTRNRYAVRLRFEVKGFDPAAANRMPDSVQPDSGQAA